MRDTGVEEPNLLETCLLDSEISLEQLAYCRRSKELVTGSKLPLFCPKIHRQDL